VHGMLVAVLAVVSVARSHHHPTVQAGTGHGVAVLVDPVVVAVVRAAHAVVHVGVLLHLVLRLHVLLPELLGPRADGLSGDSSDDVVLHGSQLVLAVGECARTLERALGAVDVVSAELGLELLGLDGSSIACDDAMLVGPDGHTGVVQGLALTHGHDLWGHRVDFGITVSRVGSVVVLPVVGVGSGWCDIALGGDGEGRGSCGLSFQVVRGKRGRPLLNRGSNGDGCCSFGGHVVAYLNRRTCLKCGNSGKFRKEKEKGNLS